MHATSIYEQNDTKITKNSPLAVMLNWQHSYISNMTYKHGNLGQTELVCGL